MLELVHHHLHEWNTALPEVFLHAERFTLAKRRWSGKAEDGAEFGFQLDHPLEDGDVFATTEAAVYRIRQKPEPVVEIELASDPGAAARLGWLVGNLHFQLEVVGHKLRLADDPALHQLFTREKIAFVSGNEVFRPLSGGHSHSHDHH